MDTRMKIIIDTDPGIDDTMAIFYAHAAPDIELLGLTTVFGNVTVRQATRNALYLTDMLGIDIPVAEGAGVPMDGAVLTPPKHVHGDEGFGDFTDIPERTSPHSESAPEFLVRMAREHKGELVINAVSPLTNIAAAIELDPEFVTNIQKLVIMGGAVDCPGNVNAYAEANIFHDAKAAEIVLSSGAPIVLVGLDVTLKTLCSMEDFRKVASKAPVTGGFLERIAEFYVNFYRDVAGQEGCGLHDSTALIACTNPELFTMEEVAIDVLQNGDEAGQTIRAAAPGKPVISVCLGVDGEAVTRLFLDRISLNP